MNQRRLHAVFGTIALLGCSPTRPPAVRTSAPMGLSPRAVSPGELADWLNDPKVALARKAAEAEPARAGDGAGGGAGGDDGDEKAGAGVDAPAPPDPEPIMRRAVAAHERGDRVEARSAALEVIALDATGYPYAYVILGDLAASEKDLTGAIERYRKALELDPKDGWAAQRLAQVLSRLGRGLEARAVLRGFTGDHPDADPDVWDALAWLELEHGEPARAEAAFRKALERSDDKDAEALYGLAMIHARRDDAVAVEKDLQGLFALQPGRRLVIERDPTFFRVRIHPNVAALFSGKRMAEARAAAPPEELPPQKLVIAVPAGASTALVDAVRFDYDSAKPRPESKAVLDQVAAFLLAQKGLDFVRVVGHADRRGDEAYNIQLSEHRAQAVRDALVARGVPASLLTTKGYGVYCPLDDGNDESAFAKNRRVEFSVGASGKVAGEELSCLERMKRWLTPGSPAASALSPAAP